MNKSEVYERCLEFSNGGKIPLRGMWFNEKQFRLEVVSYRPEQFWVSLDLLFEIAKQKDDLRKTMIATQMEPLRTMLLDFFYSGWTFSYYLKNGRQAVRGY